MLQEPDRSNAREEGGSSWNAENWIVRKKKLWRIECSFSTLHTNTRQLFGLTFFHKVSDDNSHLSTLFYKLSRVYQFLTRACKSCTLFSTPSDTWQTSSTSSLSLRVLLTCKDLALEMLFSVPVTSTILWQTLNPNGQRAPRVKKISNRHRERPFVLPDQPLDRPPYHPDDDDSAVLGRGKTAGNFSPILCVFRSLFRLRHNRRAICANHRGF